MIGSILLLMVGLVDFIVGRRWRSLMLRLVLLGTIAALAVIGLGFEPLIAAACAVIALCWVWATRPSKSTPKDNGDSGVPAPRLWPPISLFVLVFVITAYDRTPETAKGFLVDAHSAAVLKSAASISLETVLAAIAAGFFLLKSANNVTLAALGRAHEEDASKAASASTETEATSAESKNKWELFISSVKVASVRAGEKPKRGPELKGGRLIGPIERLLIVVLAFAGAPQIIAALAAAKGIVRFPEISEDRGSGSKAEEFLVGSLASWTLSAIAVLYLNFVHKG
ncbi:hypothetical protein OCL88_19975 [Paenarthrobacter sp. PAE-2]|uniref:hypothetical protein n=1 Tax=Paenarthrobacter sp. PAE-2 TaxID=2982532 RepID=UPI00222F10B0|nr:hypothetical protein [Paenarthrobacter sp. PAE-2]MCW3768755.1 hypothetical protein [Paenarthrobacter sp. PAE-2]